MIDESGAKEDQHEVNSDQNMSFAKESVASANKKSRLRYQTTTADLENKDSMADSN